MDLAVQLSTALSIASLHALPLSPAELSLLDEASPLYSASLLDSDPPLYVASYA